MNVTLDGNRLNIEQTKGGKQTSGGGSSNTVVLMPPSATEDQIQNATGASRVNVMENTRP